MAEPIKTTCPYCGVGCGVLVGKDPAGGYTVKGDPEHPANFGRLCSKGSALGETLGDEGRLLYPHIKGQRVSWNAALDRVAEKFNSAIETYGPDSVAFYVSGQLMTEAYYVANKLMKGFIGSANIDTNSRLCMASSVAGHKRAFGSDTVPGNYRDFDEADLVVLVGSNLAWCHPVLYQRLAAAKKNRGAKVVVIDPRRTATCDLADLHLALHPGTDVKLFNGLFARLVSENKQDNRFVESHTNDLSAALKVANEDAPNLLSVAKTCCLSPNDLALFMDWFANIERTVTVYSQGVNQSSQGADKVNAIINCHLLTGRIGKPGCGPFSVTGQPNAMGGREVGGLANTLAAHMDFDKAAIDRVGRFWAAERMATKPGLKAVDLFNAVHEGKIKALWIMATNPAVSLPNANKVREALNRCPFVVVSDCVQNNDTLTFADTILPSTTWGERDGTVTNSERRISRQRPFKPASGEAREDWDIICATARRMGFRTPFSYDGPAAIFKEHAALSAFENGDQRDFDLGLLTKLGTQAYEMLEPIQWPVKNYDQQGKGRFFSDGGFFTKNGRANFIAVSHQKPQQALTENYPLALNTGRCRDQWHTMTRSGLSPRLALHRTEPTVEIHPDDTETYGLKDGDLARLSSAWGEALLRVRFDEGQQPGNLFVPIHWSDTNSANAVISRLIHPGTDPISGQPESKFTPVQIKTFRPKWHALLIARSLPELPSTTYWTAITGINCTFITLAGDEEVTDWPQWAEKHIKGYAHEWLTFSDPAGGRHRFAGLKDGLPQSALFISRDDDLPGLDWAQAQFALEALDDKARTGLLAGRTRKDQPAPGAIVCSCFNVGINDITRAITEGRVMTVEAVGKALKAGTNCGSCRPEIQAVLDNQLPTQTNTPLQQATG